MDFGEAIKKVQDDIKKQAEKERAMKPFEAAEGGELIPPAPTRSAEEMKPTPIPNAPARSKEDMGPVPIPNAPIRPEKERNS